MNAPKFNAQPPSGRMLQLPAEEFMMTVDALEAILSATAPTPDPSAALAVIRETTANHLDRLRRSCGDPLFLDLRESFPPTNEQREAKRKTA